MRRKTTRWGGLAIVLVTAALSVQATSSAQAMGAPKGPKGEPAAAGAPAKFDRTSGLEARRIASSGVKAPRWDHDRCREVLQKRPTVECAFVQVPMDYDNPSGPKVTLGVAKLPARKESNGTIFVNPGGPGSSAIDLIKGAYWFFPEKMRDKFDIVAVNPRGVGNSDLIRCGATQEEDEAVADALDRVMMARITSANRESLEKDAAYVGTMCSKHGGELIRSMSTAEYVRDMESIRTAMGIDKVRFLGWSYGSYVGQVYANMFPDRFAAIAIDGVADPLTWNGALQPELPLQVRKESSGQGADRAIMSFLDRCGKVGVERCGFASGDLSPREKYDFFWKEFGREPVSIDGVGRVDQYKIAQWSFEYLTYGSLAPKFLSDIYGPLYNLAAARQAQEAGARVDLKAVTRTAAEQLNGALAQLPRDRGLSRGFQQIGIVCTDGEHPADVSDWYLPALAHQRETHMMSALWDLWDMPCASNTWTAQDEDRYQGTFRSNTKAPVLVIGNYYDPQTNYQGAVKSHQLLPNSRLISSSNWGHTAIGTSDCVDDAVLEYFLTGEVPAQDLRCRSEASEFAAPTPEEQEAANERILVFPRPWGLGGAKQM